MIALPLAAPALPLHTAGKYVAGAYIVFVALIVIYVSIMARRLARTQRELAELRREAEFRGGAERAVAPDLRQREPVAAGRIPPAVGEPRAGSSS